MFRISRTLRNELSGRKHVWIFLVEASSTATNFGARKLHLDSKIQVNHIDKSDFVFIYRGMRTIFSENSRYVCQKHQRFVIVLDADYERLLYFKYTLV